MKPKELREKKGEELEALERDLRRELAEAELKFRMGTLGVSRRLELRRDIARVLTIRKEQGK